jgi:hypothetical protein
MADRDAIPGERARVALLRRSRGRRRRRRAQLIDLLLHLADLILERLNVRRIIRKNDSWRCTKGSARAHCSQDRLAQLKLLHCINSRGFRLLDLIDVLLHQDDSMFYQ